MFFALAMHGGFLMAETIIIFKDDQSTGGIFGGTFK
jgi:hypothetical protein